MFTLIWGITLLTTIQEKNHKLVRILGKMTRTEKLLTDKEIRGLRITFYVKILFIITLIPTSFSPKASLFEKTVTSGLSITLILITLVLLFLLKKRKKLAYLKK